RFAVGAATLSLLAESGPLAVLVDDAQWLDEASAEALRFAFRRLMADPIAVLVAVREGEPSLLDGADLPALHLAGPGPGERGGAGGARRPPAPGDRGQPAGAARAGRRGGRTGARGRAAARLGPRGSRVRAPAARARRARAARAGVGGGERQRRRGPAGAG